MEKAEAGRSSHYRPEEEADQAGRVAGEGVPSNREAAADRRLRTVACQEERLRELRRLG